MDLRETSMRLRELVKNKIKLNHHLQQKEKKERKH